MFRLRQMAQLSTKMSQAHNPTPFHFITSILGFFPLLLLLDDVEAEGSVDSSLTPASS